MDRPGTTCAASNTGSALVPTCTTVISMSAEASRRTSLHLGTNPAHSIARWNPATNSVDNLNSISVDGSVRAVASWNGELIVGGSFSILGGNPHHGIARWNGSSWISDGLTAGNVHHDPALHRRSLRRRRRIERQCTTEHGSAGRWSGGSWSSVGGTFPGSISDMTLAYNGRLIATGAYAERRSPNILQLDAVLLRLGPRQRHRNDRAHHAALRRRPSSSAARLRYGADGIAMNRMAIWNGSGWSSWAGDGGRRPGRLTNFMGQLVGAAEGSASQRSGSNPPVNIVGWNGIVAERVRFRPQRPGQRAEVLQVPRSQSATSS